MGTQMYMKIKGQGHSLTLVQGHSDSTFSHFLEASAWPTSDHGVAGSNPAGGEILPEPKLRFIAQSLSCSPFHRLEMTEILLKGRKTLTHPSIHTSFPEKPLGRLKQYFIWSLNGMGKKKFVQMVQVT